MQRREDHRLPVRAALAAHAPGHLAQIDVVPRLPEKLTWVLLGCVAAPAAEDPDEPAGRYGIAEARSVDRGEADPGHENGSRTPSAGRESRCWKHEHYPAKRRRSGFAG
jgi:hypothetical protein